MIEVLAVGIAMVVGVVVLASPGVRSSEAWRATVTPLASIIGSGFLVLAPLLSSTVGGWAPVAMAGIVALGYAIGATVRFNITHAEAMLERGDAPAAVVDVDRVGQFLLGLAYMISVGFYLRLLAAFVLDQLGSQSALAARVVTTVILLVIALVGWFRGLHGIEAFEVPAVDLKLVVIGGLLAGMLVHAIGHASVALDSFGRFPVAHDAATVFRRLAGMLLVVQGFETSRYLGGYYAAPLRVRTMRRAQLASGAIYVAFAVLVVPLFDHLGNGSRETAILDAARFVTPLLAPLLVIAAAASQLSAAAADTAGGSEMITQRSRSQRNNAGYLVVTAGAALVVWATDVFGIVSIASRAFAAYYLCQALVAALVARRRDLPRSGVVVVANLALALLLAVVVFVAVPGE